MKQGVLFVLAAVTALAGCSLGQGQGKVSSERLIATDCWDDKYDLSGDYNADPNAETTGQDLFFAAIPYRDTLAIRVQRGTDIEEVSDGLNILVDDVPRIRNAIALADAKDPSNPQQHAFHVSLPAGVHPPGTPVEPPSEFFGEVPIVHMALYLQRSCHNQNTILYSFSGTITFNSLFSGDPNEKDAAQKKTDATFDVLVGDPRDAPLGAQADKVPPELQSHLTGNFSFFFERGQPGQPFP